MPDPDASWRRWLGYRVAGPLALVLALLLLATHEVGYRAAQQVSEWRDVAVDARSVVDEARRVVVLMESAQRGYLLTGRAEYRTPFDALRREAAPSLARLRELAGRYPAQRDNLRLLAEVSERRFSELEEVMRLWDQGDRNAAMELMLTDIGREQMERLVALGDAVRNEEAAAYVRSGELHERVRRWTRLAIIALVLLCLATVVGALKVSRTRARERAQHLADLSAERDKLEAEVGRRTQELTDLARYLQSVREGERSRLARELHDELGGLLTAAKLDVARVRKRVLAAGPEAVERVDHLGQMLDAGIALKRRIIEDLRPSALDNLGLQRALEILCDEFAQRAELQVAADIEGLKLDGERSLAVYRLVQEALTNVARHARARQVRVSLRRAGERAQVQVQDDGVGFDAARVAAGSHGLAGMRFRMQSCGGDWLLLSAPGQGTTVQASFPL